MKTKTTRRFYVVRVGRTPWYALTDWLKSLPKAKKLARALAKVLNAKYQVVEVSTTEKIYKA